MILVTEANVETPALDWLVNLRGEAAHGPDIGSNGTGGRCSGQGHRPQPPHPASIFGRKYTSASSCNRWKYAVS